MKQISTRAFALLFMVLLFTAGTVFFIFNFVTYGDNWATYPTNRHLYTNGSLVKAGTITDRNGTMLAETVNGVRSFSSNVSIRKATLHAVGDLQGKISTGIHTAFLNQLTGYDLINGTYNLSGEENDIQLTLDSDLCVTAMKALGSYSGTVGIYNYKTGEIICMVSTPTADPNSLATLDPAKAQTGLYVNRLLSGTYAPGSVFKLVTTVAALDNIKNIDDKLFTCNAGVEIEGEWVSCPNNHGKISLNNALVKSCNATFAQLAVELGSSTMMRTTEKLGFNKSFHMDGIKTTASNYSVKGARNIDLAWSGMGQYNDMVNPFHYLVFMGAIANGGVPVNPYLVENIYTYNGISTYFRFNKNGSRMMSTFTANTLAKMMRNNVSEYYGDSNFPGLNLCAKTGTAEVGNESPHSWFVGFSQNENKPYAFVVVAENAGSGIKFAGNIANKVLQAAPSVK